MGLGKWLEWMELYREKFELIKNFVFILAFVTIIPTLKAAVFRWLVAIILLYMLLDFLVQDLKAAGIRIRESGILDDVEISDKYNDIIINKKGKIVNGNYKQKK